MNFRSFARKLNIATPYNFRETIGWIARNIIGPGKRNIPIPHSIPNPCILNKAVKPEYEACFVGDIMPTFKRRVRFSRELKDFAGKSNFLVGNLSGTITDERKKFPDISFDQRHVPEVRDMLADFFPPNKTYLSVCNNHMGDFSNDALLSSASMLESRGFKVFGWNDRPYADVNKDIRILVGTMWSNRDSDTVCKLEQAETYIKPGAFNFLYPHIGYELESNPRPEIISLGKGLIKKFDAVIGDHPHWPQSVTSQNLDGVNKLLLYSMGDFCGGLPLKKYQYGIILKAGVGRNADGRLLIGRVDWRLTRFAPVLKNEVIVNIINTLAG